MGRMMLLTVLVICLSGCENKYQSGYDAGFAAGFTQASSDAEKRIATLQDELNAARRQAELASTPSSAHVETAVCGGSGFTFNGKHYAPGKTGCVKAMSDGTVQRY